MKRFHEVLLNLSLLHETGRKALAKKKMKKKRIPISKCFFFFSSSLLKGKDRESLCGKRFLDSNEIGESQWLEARHNHTRPTHTHTHTEVNGDKRRGVSCCPVPTTHATAIRNSSSPFPSSKNFCESEVIALENELLTYNLFLYHQVTQLDVE